MSPLSQFDPTDKSDEHKTTRQNVLSPPGSATLESRGVPTLDTMRNAL
jgi:hypothetical protein